MALTIDGAVTRTRAEDASTARAADLAERLLDEVVRSDHRWEVVHALAGHIVNVSERAMALS